MRQNILTRNLEGAGSWCGMSELPIRYDLPSANREPGFEPFCDELKKIHKTNCIETCSSHSSQLQSTVLLTFQRHTTQLGRVAAFEWGRNYVRQKKIFWTFWNLFSMCFSMVYHPTLINKQLFLVILRSGTDSWPRQVNLFFFFFFFELLKSRLLKYTS